MLKGNAVSTGDVALGDDGASCGAAAGLLWGDLLGGRRVYSWYDPQHDPIILIVTVIVYIITLIITISITSSAFVTTMLV